MKQTNDWLLHRHPRQNSQHKGAALTNTIKISLSDDIATACITLETLTILEKINCVKIHKDQ